MPEETKEPETIKLYSDDLSEIVREEAENLVDDIEAAPDLYELRDDVAQKLHIDEMVLYEAPVPVDEIEPEDFFEKLDPAHNEEHREAMMDALEEQIWNNDSYLYDCQTDGLEWRQESLGYDLENMGLLKKEEPYLVFGNDLDWRHSSGVKCDDVADAEDVINLIRPDFDHTMELTKTEGEPFLRGVMYSHDVPMGSTFTIIPASWMEKALEIPELGECIQRTMDLNDDIRNTVYDAVPSLYEGKLASRALRDEIVDRSLPRAYCWPREEADDAEFERLARHVLTFDTDKFLADCAKECGYEPDELDDPFRRDVVFETCRDKLYDAISEAPKDQKIRPEALKAVKEVLATRRPEKIGPMVEALTQDGKKKALAALIQSSRKKNSGR